MEKFVENLGCDVYPITFTKFLLNKRKILNYFLTAAKNDPYIRENSFLVTDPSCSACASKVNMLCRQHNSIQRVLTADNVAHDLDTNSYFYKNEIFRMVDDKLVIVYCPHSKLIAGSLTDEKIRKVSPITICDPDLKELPNFKNVKKFLSSELMGLYTKCWFNESFSIITNPHKSRDFSNFTLVINN
jgi:hypothetical protein